MRYLQDAEPGTFIHGPDEEDYTYINYNLQTFFGYMGHLGLEVTPRVADNLEQMAMELAEADAGDRLTATQAEQLSYEMTEVRRTLEAELQGFEAFIVSPKRINVDRLLEDVESLFSPGVFESLPHIAQYDLREAGKCIAFERATAAAFHLMRAMEGVLRIFYDQLMEGEGDSRMWGPIIADLQDGPGAQEYDVLLDHLDNIRRSFRNPTQHPDAKYGIERVQDLWGLSVDAINRMADELMDETN